MTDDILKLKEEIRTSDFMNFRPYELSTLKAMIPAAGVGSRLSELTASCPKSLIEVNSKPLLQHVLENIFNLGIQDVLINLHHFPDMIRDFCRAHDNFKLNIHFSDESALLLDTGGGLKKGEHFFAGCKNILVWNSDILSNINIHNLLNFHQHHQNDVSLAVRNRDSSRKLLFDKNNSLSGWRHKTENKEILVENKSGPFHEFAFSGIHLLKREFLDNFPPADHPYGLVKTWLDNASENTIAAFEHSEDYWFDCGKPETLNAANNFYKGRPK